MNIITTKQFWCSLPNTKNEMLGDASYDTAEEAIAAAEKRTEPKVVVMGTGVVMGAVSMPAFVKLVEH